MSGVQVTAEFSIVLPGQKRPIAETMTEHNWPQVPIATNPNKLLKGTRLVCIEDLEMLAMAADIDKTKATRGAIALKGMPSRKTTK